MLFSFECPRCGQHISADTSEAGRQGPCPSCQILLTIPNHQPIMKAPAPIYSEPKTTPYTNMLAEISASIQKAESEIAQSKATRGIRYCDRCGTMVPVYLETLYSAGPGYLISNGYGMAMYRQTTNSEMAYCCRQCGRRIVGASAVFEVERQYEETLRLRQQTLRSVERREKMWRALRRFSFKHPYIAGPSRILLGLRSLRSKEIT